jgi:hypothetical protein
LKPISDDDGHRRQPNDKEREMKRPVIIAGVVAALAAAGTAIAASDAPTANLRTRDAQFARELAANLGHGVTAAEVQRALQKVREQHVATRRAELARALAPRLNLSVNTVEQGLEKAQGQIRQAFESGKRPDPGLFVRTLAQELDKSESQVREALQAARRELLNKRLDAAVRAGRLSQQQADAIRRRVEQGAGRFWLGRGYAVTERPGPR